MYQTSGMVAEYGAQSSEIRRDFLRLKIFATNAQFWRVPSAPSALQLLSTGPQVPVNGKQNRPDRISVEIFSRPEISATNAPFRRVFGQRHAHGGDDVAGSRRAAVLDESIGRGALEGQDAVR